MPVPTTVKQVRQILGFGNFYRKIISRYSSITCLLNELLKKEHKFIWLDECKEAFQILKQKFTEEPVLQMLDINRPFLIEADVSKYTLGAVLCQEDENGKLHLCLFISKSFSPTEQNYAIYNRELLAVLRDLWEWKYYILGSNFITTVYSDHQNLLYYRKPQKLSF